MTDLNKERMELELSAGVLDRQIDNLKDEISEGCFDDNMLDELIDMAIKLGEVYAQRDAIEKAKAQAVPEWISAEVGSPIKFGTRVKIKRKSWDEEDNLIFVESEATYDKDSDFCELSNRSYEYETWFDHELNRYLDEDELTHWAPLDKSESGAEG
ncbi:hypothetical protein ABTO95_07175 [Acinetobacter baumannii]|uniref:hypothetical protein n=1 Tax=Acinetobacter baumannii TaxID=470 RepID=UPI00280F60DD|nr:hypothetical protein [Acinetobacter baumannii]MDQ8959214.1 hypothetical protein [Acinetobacter baumannii]